MIANETEGENNTEKCFLTSFGVLIDTDSEDEQDNQGWSYPGAGERGFNEDGSVLS